MFRIRSIIILLLAVIMFNGVVCAKDNSADIKRSQAVAKETTANKEQVNKIEFNGQEYFLKRSTNKTPSGEYVNEYYKENESPEGWTEMITVSEFPKYEGGTMDYADMILSVDHSPNNYDRPVSCNSKTDKVTFVYLMRGKKNDVYYTDFNVMQVLPYKNRKGLKCFQYSNKHTYLNKAEYASEYQKMENEKQKYFDLVKDVTMPDVVQKNIP
ncbi:MAG: hypothetical protein K6E29_07350 [Cyanobacteria bacterium RUI128]|nr:hypothetical protein [Cyanobacteria bacterium RUI128]